MRKGRSGRKANSTQKEIEARVEYVAALLTKQPNLSRYALHRQLCEKWNVHWRTVDIYIVRAREGLRNRLKRTQEEIRSNAVAFYEAIISDKRQHKDVRLRALAVKAQENLCKLLGVETPQKIEVTNPDGSMAGNSVAVQVLLNSMSVEQLQSIVDQMQEDETLQIEDNKEE